MNNEQSTIAEALALANRLDGLRSFGPEHFAELQAAVDTIRALVHLLTAGLKEETTPTATSRCRFFDFGTAPLAKKLGYYLVKTTHGTDKHLHSEFGDQDVILVRGARCASVVGAYEYAVFVPAPRYTVLSLHKTQGWHKRTSDVGLWGIGDQGGMSERTWIIQDADLNRLTLTQHQRRDLPLDSASFNAGQHAIASTLTKIGLLHEVSRNASAAVASLPTC